MSKKFLVDIDLQQNELKGAVIENLAAAPANPKPGQHYFSTVDNTEYFWDGTKWVNGSGDFTFTNGIEQDGRNVQIAVATGEHAGNVVLTADANGLAADVDLSGKVDKLATKPTAGEYTKVTINGEGQVTAGATLSESDIPDLHLAKVTDVTATAAEVNKLAGLATTATELGYVHGVTSAIQTQLDGKVAANTAITGATKTKITYDSKGLVTAGDDLAESDIPSLHLAKITDVTATAAEVNVLDGITASTEELNILDGVTADASELNILDGATLTTTELNYVDGVTSSIQDQLNDKLELDSLSVAATSANYMTYDNTSGEFTLNVDSTPTASSNNLVTSGGVKSYVDGKISTTYKAAGSVAFANLPTLGADYEGYVYNVTDAFTTTADFVEGASKDYPAGTNVVIINTAASGQTAVYKYDVLAGFVDVSDFITADSVDTLENKTISADDNTISDLTTSNLKSGVLQTTVRATASASDTALASEKAIAAALDGKQDKVAAAVENNIASWDAAGNTKDSGKAFVTAIGPATGTGAATDAEIPTAKATRTLVDSAISAGKATVTNGALTPDANNVCTWSITGLAADPYSIVILDNSGNEVIADIAYGTKSATIKMNSASTISADSFSAKILM